MVWRDMLRRFHVPLPHVLYLEPGLRRYRLDALDADAVRVRRIALYGACSAAAAVAGKESSVASAATSRTAFAAMPAGSVPSGFPDAVTWVDLDLASACFDRAFENPDSCEDLASVFQPTAFLFEESLRGGSNSYFCLEDGAAPQGIHTGLAAVVSVQRSRLRTLGETFFVPPVLPRDGSARAAWVEARRLDPPLHGEPGGPFWRLGRHGMWRLDVLAWNEVLALAALIGTNAKTAVLVAPRHLVPRVGFVAELARQMGRSLVGVPLEACPRPLRGLLRDLQVSDVSFDLSLFTGTLGLDRGGEDGAVRTSRQRLR